MMNELRTESERMTEHPVVTEIRRLAAERPDHQDPDALAVRSCRYYDDDNQPSCIVGHVLHNLYPSFYTPAWEGGAAYRVLQCADPGIPAVVLNWARDVQVAQDSGYAWANAVTTADGYGTLS